MSNKNRLPSPVTHLATGDTSERTSPTPQIADVATPRKTEDPHELSQALSSPPQDTQPLSQFVDPHSAAVAEEEEDEIREGVWGYLVALDPKYGDRPLVMKRRNACPTPEEVGETRSDRKALDRKDKPNTVRDEEAYERTKVGGAPSGGYLIGRHPECGKLILYTRGAMTRGMLTRDMQTGSSPIT